MTTQRNKGGRPRLPADPNKPRRLNSLAEVENSPDDATVENSPAVGETGEGLPGASNEPIIVSPGTKENAPPTDPQTDSPDDNPKDTDEVVYYCQDCQTPLMKGERNCPGCGERLAW